MSSTNSLSPTPSPRRANAADLTSPDVSKQTTNPPGSTDFSLQLSEFQLFSVANESPSPRQHLDRLRHFPPLGCRRANTSPVTCLVRTDRIPTSGSTLFLPHFCFQLARLDGVELKWPEP